MKIFAYRPEILCTTSCYCFRSGVNSGTTCKRHMWKRAECIAQNQREQGTARAVWFSQVTLSKRVPTSCCLSPKAGVHSWSEAAPPAHTLAHPGCPWPEPALCSRALGALMGSRSRAPGAQLTPESPPCRTLHIQPNDPIQGTSSLTPLGLAVCKPQQNQLWNFCSLHSTYCWYKWRHNSRVQGGLKKYTQRSKFQ